LSRLSARTRISEKERKRGHSTIGPKADTFQYLPSAKNPAAQEKLKTQSQKSGLKSLSADSNLRISVPRRDFGELATKAPKQKGEEKKIKV